MITDTVRLITIQLFILLAILSIAITAAVIYQVPTLLVGALLIAYSITLFTSYKSYCLFITLLAPFPIKQEHEEGPLFSRRRF